MKRMGGGGREAIDKRENISKPRLTKNWFLKYMKNSQQFRKQSIGAKDMNRHLVKEDI